MQQRKLNKTLVHYSTVLKWESFLSWVLATCLCNWQKSTENVPLVVKMSTCPTYNQPVGDFLQGERAPPSETVTGGSSSSLVCSQQNHTQMQLHYTSSNGNPNNYKYIVHSWLFKKQRCNCFLINIKTKYLH